jgi:hypothetical protein
VFSRSFVDLEVDTIMVGRRIVLRSSDWLLSIAIRYFSAGNGEFPSSIFVFCVVKIDVRHETETKMPTANPVPNPKLSRGGGCPLPETDALPGILARFCSGYNAARTLGAGSMVFSFGWGEGDLNEKGIFAQAQSNDNRPTEHEWKSISERNGRWGKRAGLST